MNPPTPTTKKKKDPITIERVITNNKGEITALDIYDEEKGQAVFLVAKGRH